MREIETAEETAAYRPKIDLSWAEAPKYFENEWGYKMAWLLPAVMLPHIVSFVAGAVLFIMGWIGLLKLADGKTMPL